MTKLQKSLQFNIVMLLTMTLAPQCIHTVSPQDTTNEIMNTDAQHSQRPVLFDIIANQNYTTQKKIIRIKDFLTNHNFDVNERDANGKTALNFIASLKCDSALAQLLIQAYKADVNIPDLFNVTPLHHAIDNEDIELARMLLEAGADTRFKNDNQETPIDLAHSEKTKFILGLETEAHGEENSI